MRVIIIDLTAEHTHWVSISGLQKQRNSDFNLFNVTDQSVDGLINFEKGGTISSVITHISSCLCDELVAIAFEAPMYWLFERSARFGSESNRWSNNGGSQATALAYYHGYSLIQEIIKLNSKIKFTFDVSQWGKERILLFEAYATGACKPINKKMGYNMYKHFSMKLNIGPGIKSDDWVDAMNCAVSFFAFYYASKGNSFYLDRINDTFSGCKKKQTTLEDPSFKS